MQIGDTVIIVVPDDQFTGYTGIVRSVERVAKNYKRNRPSYYRYLIAIDTTVHELWFAENEIKKGN